MKSKLILIAVLVFAFMFFVGNTKVVASIVTSCSGQINGQQCFLSDGKSNGACYNGQCITSDEYAYNVAKEMCAKLFKNNGCYNIEPFKESDGSYSCTKKSVGSSCSILYSCRGPGCLAGAPSTCDATPKCVRQISPDNDKDGNNKCQLALYLADGYRYTGGDLPTTCGSALNTRGCDESSCPRDCDDNDPYDSTIRLADIEKVEVVMDPDYKKETKDKRKFTPQLPVTPFDNFNIIATVKKKCGVTSISQMPILPISLITFDAAGKEVVVASGSLTPIDTTTYQWKLVGWPDGITTNDEIMEILIDSIASKRKIYTRITGAYPDEKPKETPIVMGNCVQTYRDGKHKVVTMRGKSASFAPSFLFKFANTTFAEGFEIIEPFKSNINSFSSYVDLVNHDDTKWAMLIPDTLYNLWNRPKKISSCGADGSQYFFINGRTYEGISLYKIRVVYLLTSSVDAHTAMHETGHSFCGLLDEYLGSPFERIFYPEGLNCPVSPRNNYYYNGKLYGDAFWKGCTRDSVFRPSKNSLMNQGAKHSVIDCGYCMSAIKGGSVREHWPECMKLDTIKPDCKAGSCPGKLFCSPKALQDDPACAHPNAFVCNSATGLCEYT